MLSDLAFTLASDGCRVRVVTSRQTYEDPRAMLPVRQVQGGIEIRRVWTTRFGRMNLIGRALDYASFYLATFWVLLRIARRGDVIIAKTDPPLISVIAWIAAKAKRAKLINWLQDVFPEVAVALGVLTWRPLVGLIRWLRNLSLRGAAMNVVLGERMQELICAQGVARASTAVIHNWADGNLVKPVSRAANALRDSWNLRDKFVVGYSGNMGRAHEFDTIVGAMKCLREDKNVVFVFIGNGAGKEPLERAIGECGLRNFLFLPYQPRERLSESLSVPDVHLVSLRPGLEGLIVPSKVYGIAAAGRPAIFIGDPDGEVGRLVTRYDFGFAVPAGAEKVLTERIRKLKQEPELGLNMGANGRRCFEENFERSHAIAAWRRLLAPLAGFASASVS
jgi:glycosyltransferase involved in cell wall biosynthesis